MAGLEVFECDPIRAPFVLTAINYGGRGEANLVKYTKYNVEVL